MTYHKKMSYIKSIIRILGYNLLFYSITLAAIFLIISEVVGILEERNE